MPKYATFEGTAFRGVFDAPVEGMENIPLTESQAKKVESKRITYPYKPDTFECWALKAGAGAVRIVK